MNVSALTWFTPELSLCRFKMYDAADLISKNSLRVNNTLPWKSHMTAASSFPPETQRVCVVSPDSTHVGCCHGDRGSACDVSQSEANANMLGAC